MSSNESSPGTLTEERIKAWIQEARSASGIPSLSQGDRTAVIRANPLAEARLQRCIRLLEIIDTLTAEVAALRAEREGLREKLLSAVAECSDAATWTFEDLLNTVLDRAAVLPVANRAVKKSRAALAALTEERDTLKRALTCFACSGSGCFACSPGLVQAALDEARAEAATLRAQLAAEETWQHEAEGAGEAWRECQAELATVRAQLTRRTEALRPFARAAEYIDDSSNKRLTDDIGLWTPLSNVRAPLSITIGHVREARRALDDAPAS